MDTYAEWIALILTNFALSMLCLSILFIVIDAVLHRDVPLPEIIFRWLALFALGVTSIYAFMMHAFFADFTAAAIGWQPSPFQFEVAVANLTFGVLAVMSYNANYHFRVATVIGGAFWLWGDAFGHVFPMIISQQFTVRNAGSWFWVDLVLPLMLAASVLKLKHVK